MGADCCSSIFGRLMGTRHGNNKMKKHDQGDDELYQFLQIDYSDDGDEDDLCHTGDGKDKK